ncbi:MAG: hypothetical protein ACI3XC_03685 [Phascolarctobacterium sp.]
MDKATFIEKAQDICLSSFVAYFVENDMAKSCAHMPPDRFKSFCIKTLNNQVNYVDFLDYIMPTENYERSAFIEDIQLHTPFVTEELCVVLLTAKVYFVIDNGYKIHIDCRVSYLVTQKQGQLEILHLHYSMPHKSLRNINLTKQDKNRPNAVPNPNTYVTKGAATAAGLYSPNGLMFYQLSGKEQINFVNKSLLQLLGYKDIDSFFTHSQRNLRNIIVPQDWPAVQAQLTQQEPQRVFNLNASFYRQDGSTVKVLLRGNFVDQHNRFYVLSLTPLVVPEEQLYYGDFSLEAKYSEDYHISYELFLKIGLDIFLKYGRIEGIPHMLELCTMVLNAHNGWICDVRSLDTPIKLVHFYTAAGYKKIIPVNIPAHCALYFFHKFNSYYYDSLEEMPSPLQDLCKQKGITSWISSTITCNNQNSFVLYFLRQENSAPWTDNEKLILQYATKIFALALDAYAKKNPEPTRAGGVQ